MPSSEVALTAIGHNGPYFLTRRKRRPNDYATYLERVDQRIEMGVPVPFDVDCLNRYFSNRHVECVAFDEHGHFKVVAGRSECQALQSEADGYSPKTGLCVF